MRIVRGKKIAAEVAALRNRRPVTDAPLEASVRRIVTAVRRGGDRALRRYAEQWDGLGADQAVRVTSDEMTSALRSIPAELRTALQRAASNIRRFCEWQKPRDFRREMQPGICVGQVIRPLQSVGCYVPGGRYPLPSSLLMTVIPAQVAGVGRITVVSPRPAPETLAAAAMLGVRDFFRIGGAQAIAALAYGTERIDAVDKIVGPGNSFVTAAKKIVAFDCAIDFLAGPTEVVIACDDGSPEFIAADLIAQAEHDPESMAVFVTSSAQLAKSVSDAVDRGARGNAIARESLRRNGRVLLTSSHEELIETANAIAAEHITVSLDDVAKVTNAGSIFVGDYSPQALGDYAAGPNHVLPTGGAARFRGGLTVLDFVKIISVQEVSRAGLRRIAPVVETLAKAEGLRAHAESVRVRCAHA